MPRGDARLTYRRNNPYNTKSNRVRVSRTPGNKLVYLHEKKRGTAPKCGYVIDPPRASLSLRDREHDHPAANKRP
ncbi:MAG: 60S ribosomal protein L34 [Chrysothrix sp. TS-e1954]|nr:MAG: 60S ribosomal protein L34 [Chrysothrix sp. TS-e1954]